MSTDAATRRGRRRLLAASALAALPHLGCKAIGADGLGQHARHHSMTLYTFGDSVLDCGHYNEHGVTPGQLIIRNDDALFPEFKGRDLISRGAARLVHRAVDGATIAGLPSQLDGVKLEPDSTAIVSVGGNDLLGGLAADKGPGVSAFEQQLDNFWPGSTVAACCSRPSMTRPSATIRRTSSASTRRSPAPTTVA
jgi:hypothetical protein